MPRRSRSQRARRCASPGERSVSLAAIRYVAERCRHELVGGSVKNLLWVVAYLVVKGEKTTPEVWLGTLKDMTGDDLRTVQRARDVLCSPAVGELKIHVGAAKRVVYELAKFEVQGELFGLRTPGQDDSRHHDKLSRSPVRHHVKLSRSIASDCRDVTTNCRDVEQPLYVRTLEEEEEPSSSEQASEKEPSGTEGQELQRFLAWWTSTYPTENRGRVSIIRTCDRVAARILLQSGLTVERMQAMAIALWRTTSDGRAARGSFKGSDRWWIAEIAEKGGRSISTLLHKADFLQGEVERLGFLDTPSDFEVDYKESLESVARRAPREAENEERAAALTTSQSEAEAAIDGLAPPVRDALKADARAALADQMNRSPLLPDLGMEPRHYERVLHLTMVRLILEREEGAVWAERLAAASRAG